jgi:hypothetical protein
LVLSVDWSIGLLGGEFWHILTDPYSPPPHPQPERTTATKITAVSHK